MPNPLLLKPLIVVDVVKSVVESVVEVVNC